MSIPLYFAIEENEAAPEANARIAQLGFGFREDGSLLLPKQMLPDAPAIVNDRYLPASAPDAADLDRLAEACANGCFLDFERPLDEVGAAIALGLRQRLKGKMAVPPALHAICPEANVQIPALLCNHWEAAMRRIEAAYGTQWILELIPWNASLKTPLRMEAQGYLSIAECSYRITDGTILYYDTEESLKRKLSKAEACGCQAGIILLREYRQIQKQSA